MCDQAVKILRSCVRLHLDPSEDGVKDGLLRLDDDVVHGEVGCELCVAELEELLGAVDHLEPLQQEVVGLGLDLATGEGPGQTLDVEDVVVINQLTQHLARSLPHLLQQQKIRA